MSLRAGMPTVAAFVDDLREAFGPEMVNEQIRRGMRGEPDCFHAVEGDHVLGTPFRPVTMVASAAVMQLHREPGSTGNDRERGKGRRA